MLGACSPYLRFDYVLPGWEGSTANSRVLRDALRHQNVSKFEMVISLT